jgi:two-component system OmpR family sensor kinase
MRASLTSRLVLITVALVAGAALLIGIVTTLAMADQLNDRLDDDVRASLDRAAAVPGPGPVLTPGGPGPGMRDPRGQGVGTLTAYLGDERFGVVLRDSQRGLAQRIELSDEVLDRLADDRVSNRPHDVELPGLGTYRIASGRDRGDPDVVVVAGLPTEDVDNAISSLVWWELALGLAAVGVAGGLAVVVVRRQLRPLREVAATAHQVAALPLSSGDVGVTARVPERLTDERTEVGQVGAALNTLLAHVEESLAVRQRSEEQVRQFVADASHELRTPLATITGYAELSRLRPDDLAALRTAMAKVDTESSRMAALVEDLLLLARLDSGRPLARGQVDLSRLLVEAVSDARVLGPDHTWRLDLPGDQTVEVVGDEHRLHQVISNLLTNARRHTPAGTTVTVGLRSHDRGVAVTVHDDGPGFSPALAAEAFTRFTRGDAARTRTDAGAGLGLALVHAIVEAHGGTVTLESEPGSTTFRIELTGTGSAT